MLIDYIHTHVNITVNLFDVPACRCPAALLLCHPATRLVSANSMIGGFAAMNSDFRMTQIGCVAPVVGKLQLGIGIVAVGTTVARRPHRSVLAELLHTTPASGGDAIALRWIA